MKLPIALTEHLHELFELEERAGCTSSPATFLLLELPPPRPKQTTTVHNSTSSVPVVKLVST